MIIPGRSICLVIGDGMEYNIPVRVFTQRKLAEAFVERWQKHQRRRPEPPDVIEDTPENDKLHEDYFSRYERWRNRTPGGKEHASHDSLSIVTMQVYDK